MRLIDATIQPMFLANYILERKDTFMKALKKGDNDFLFAMLIDFFDAQPTAYDVDKVVEQFKCDDCDKCSFCEACEGGIYCEICHEKAIEIVKAGGIDAN